MTEAADPTLKRRVALKVLATTLGAGAFAKALAPMQQFTDSTNVAEWLQKHYRELTPPELRKVLERLEAEIKIQYGKEVHIRDVRS